MGWEEFDSVAVFFFPSFGPACCFLMCQNIKDFLVHVQIMHYNVKVPRTFFFLIIFFYKPHVSLIKTSN